MSKLAESEAPVHGEAAPPPTGEAPGRRGAPLGIASLAVGILTILAEAANVAAGLLGAAHVLVGVLILAATVPAAIGLALGIASLVRREEDRTLGHYGLWLNGWIAVFATPLALGWTLAGA